jgi:hypothetical protein
VRPLLLLYGRVWPVRFPCTCLLLSADEMRRPRPDEAYSPIGRGSVYCRAMSPLERFGDRLALVLWALAVDVGLAWLVFHPAAAAVLQLTLIVFAVIGRFTLHHADSIARA